MPEDIKDNLTGDRGGKESPNFFIKGAEKANVGRMDNKEITKEEAEAHSYLKHGGELYTDPVSQLRRKYNGVPVATAIQDALELKRKMLQYGPDAQIHTDALNHMDKMIYSVYSTEEIKLYNAEVYPGMMKVGGEIPNNKYTDYYFVVNIDERGEYSATVYAPTDKSVYEINTELAYQLIDDGFLKYMPDEDLDRLTKHLMNLNIIPNGSQIWSEDKFPREDYEEMKRGGEIKNQYAGKTPEQVWNAWTEEQRKHFGEDHIRDWKNAEKFATLKYEQLSDSYKENIDFHIERGQYAHGGEIPTSPRKYFKAMSLSALPEKASQYITSEILTDNDIDLLEETDEDFVSVKNLIDETFPDAFPAPKPSEPEKPAKTEATVEDYIAALEGAEIQFEFSKGKEKKNLKEYIDGLKVMIETM